MDNSKALQAHLEWQGKIEIKSRVEVESQEQLSLAYTPGVADACLAIQADPSLSFRLTRRWNTVPVITDGTAVLGLGDIGPEAGMPVMEGKCALFKTFGDVDAYPLCIRSKDTEEIIRTIKLMAGSWGGINLEDIAAPRCFEIERRLQAELDIPVFHDDQHGTAIVAAAALLNALKLAGKDIATVRIVVNGAGAAGISIAKFVLELGATDVIVCDRKGILVAGDPALNAPQQEVAQRTNLRRFKGDLALAMRGADVFVGVSGPHCVTPDMVRSMADKPILFPLANPVPEIEPEEAQAAGAYIVGTGSSQHPNQINNVLVFPGLFRGAIDANAREVNTAMMLAAARGIADCIDPQSLRVDYILPYAYDRRAHESVARAVYQAAIDTGVIRQ